MKAICDFQKVRCFANTDVNEKVYSFNKTKRKHTYSPISYKRIICNNRDPSWINKNIKKKNRSTTKILHTNFIVTAKITLVHFKIFNSFNPS